MEQVEEPGRGWAAKRYDQRAKHDLVVAADRQEGAQAWLISTRHKAGVGAQDAGDRAYPIVLLAQVHRQRDRN